MSAPLLSLRDLRTAVLGDAGPLFPVDGVSLDIHRGETFALLGESGCGKSFTALSVMRLLPDGAGVVGGRVQLGGEDLLTLSEQDMRDVRGRRIAMIFQEPGSSLNPVMTVGDQLLEVLARHRGLGGAKARARVVELLDAVGIPDPARRLDEIPFQLSGGMKQRVMIAGALAGEPDLLIADEPTTALDVTIQAQVLDLLRDLQRRLGMAMLLITHDLGIVAQMAHRVAVMYAGQIVESAPAEAFFRRQAHPYARKLFDSLPDGTRRGEALSVIRGTVPPLGTAWEGCRFAPRCDLAIAECRAVAPALEPAGEDRAVRCIRRDANDSPLSTSARTTDPEGWGGAEDRPLLEVRDLKIHFPIRGGFLRRQVGAVRAVDGVSLEIRAGRTLALVGESGCGKTTIGKGIVRLLPVDAGRILFEGEDLLALEGAALRRRRDAFQIIFQDPFASLDPRMRVGEILEEGMVALGTEADADARARRVSELLDAVGLPADARTRFPHEFSGGQRQRIAIARALSVRPRLIVCDEPTSALDVSVQAQILNLLKSIQQQFGVAYLFITHNLSVVRHLADDVAVMYLGRIVESGPADAVISNPQHPYTADLLAAAPSLDPTVRTAARLRGDLPSPAAPPAGCHFHPRCQRAVPECAQRYPDETRTGAAHRVHCFRPGGEPPAA